MDKAKIKEYYIRFENWLNQHSHRDRVVILLVGWAVIYLLWYSLFEKDLLNKIQQLHQTLAAQNQQLAVYNKEFAELKEKSKTYAIEKRKAELKAKNNTITTPLASEKDNDIIIQTILTPPQDVHALRLDNTPVDQGNAKTAVKNNVQLSFNSNYFATIHYLSGLEKLPWCLSWDSLEYKVTTYPDALVVINLHIVNS